VASRAGLDLEAVLAFAQVVRVGQPFSLARGAQFGPAGGRRPFFVFGADAEGGQGGERAADGVVVCGAGLAGVGVGEGGEFRRPADGLGEAGVTADGVFEGTDGPPVGCPDKVSGVHGSLLVQPRDPSRGRCGSDFAGGVREGGYVEQVGLAEVGAQRGGGVPALVRMVGEPEVITLLARSALSTGAGRRLLRAGQRLDAEGAGEGVPAGAEPPASGCLHPDPQAHDVDGAQGAGRGVGQQERWRSRCPRDAVPQVRAAWCEVHVAQFLSFLVPGGHGQAMPSRAVSRASAWSSTSPGVRPVTSMGSQPSCSACLLRWVLTSSW
jgi:hypothetical protein